MVCLSSAGDYCSPHNDLLQPRENGIIEAKRTFGYFLRSSYKLCLSVLFCQLQKLCPSVCFIVFCKFIAYTINELHCMSGIMTNGPYVVCHILQGPLTQVRTVSIGEKRQPAVSTQTIVNKNHALISPAPKSTTGTRYNKAHTSG